MRYEQSYAIVAVASHCRCISSENRISMHFSRNRTPWIELPYGEQNSKSSDNYGDVQFVNTLARTRFECENSKRMKKRQEPQTIFVIRRYRFRAQGLCVCVCVTSFPLFTYDYDTIECKTCKMCSTQRKNLKQRRETEFKRKKSRNHLFTHSLCGVISPRL